MSGESGLGAIGITEAAALSDKVPKEGDFIMYRETTFFACGKPKYLWQRAQIEGIGDPLQDNKNLKAATLRMNPFTDKAYMKDVTIGSFNCGDGSEEGKIWFRIVDKPTVESVNQQVFVRDEIFLCHMSGVINTSSHTFANVSSFITLFSLLFFPLL
jgi:hypothetical protein